MQGMNVVPHSLAVSTLHLDPVKKYILVGHEAKSQGELRQSTEQIKDIVLIMGLEPVLVSYAVCVCEYMCDRWEDVKAPLPLMLKPAL